MPGTRTEIRGCTTTKGSEFNPCATRELERNAFLSFLLLFLFFFLFFLQPFSSNFRLAFLAQTFLKVFFGSRSSKALQFCTVNLSSSKFLRSLGACFHCRIKFSFPYYTCKFVYKLYLYAFVFISHSYIFISYFTSFYTCVFVRIIYNKNFLTSSKSNLNVKIER